MVVRKRSQCRWGIFFFGALLLFLNESSFAKTHACDAVLQATGDEDDGYGSVVIISDGSTGKRRGADEREITNDDEAQRRRYEEGELGEETQLQIVEINPTEPERNPFEIPATPAKHRPKADRRLPEKNLPN